VNLRTVEAGLLVLLVVVGPAAALAAQAGVHTVDGAGDDWQGEDVVGVSVYPASAAAAYDLESVSAADNASRWFFRVSYSLRVNDNATVALYLFGPPGGEPSTPEPRGHPFTLPAGAPLLYALYLELTPAFPAGSSLVFFDGVSWKNRTLGELGIAAARNDTDGFVELSAPRESLIFLRAGSLAAALVDPASGALQDSVPDTEPPPVSFIPGSVRFFDYSKEPPIVFSALGFSDPSAVDGQAIQIFLELTNTGPKTAAGVSAQVSIDGTTFGAREDLTLLGGNGTAVLSFGWVAVAGPHNVTAKSFPGGAARTLTAVIPGAQGVLSINGTHVEPSAPAPGQPFSVRVTVYNAGNGPSAPSELLLKDGTRVIGHAPLASIAPGGTTEASLGATIQTEGVRLLRVEINGVNSLNASATVEVPVTASPGPFGIPALYLLILGVSGAAVAMWFLTPRIVRGRRPPV
jgi:hypothetical protein